MVGRWQTHQGLRVPDLAQQSLPEDAFMRWDAEPYSRAAEPGGRLWGLRGPGRGGGSPVAARVVFPTLPASARDDVEKEGRRLPWGPLAPSCLETGLVPLSSPTALHLD